MTKQTPEITDILKQVRHLDLVTNRKVTEIFAGNYRSAFRGQGMEVADVREYEVGDDARHIDWQVTARQGKPYIKQYQETRELTTMIVLDLSSGMDFSSVGRPKAQVALETAAILLFSALKMNDKFGAILFSDEVECYIPPKKGRPHLLRILREIIARMGSKRGRGSNGQKALSFLNQMVRGHSICFFVGDALEAEGETALRVASVKHDLVYCHVYDPFERTVTERGVYEMVDPISGDWLEIDLMHQATIDRYEALRTEKYEALRTLIRSSRADWMECSTKDNVYQQWLKFFYRRQRRR